MREAYLVNNSQSIVSIPLYEKVPTVFRGKEVMRVQYQKLVPHQQLPIGCDITVEKKRYYTQFKAINIDLRFREIVKVKTEEPKVKVEEDSVKTEEYKEVAPMLPVEEESKSTVVEGLTEADLMKKRQAELIKMAIDLGIEATAQNSKAEISKMILSKQSND